MNCGLQLWSLNGYFDNDIKKQLELTAQCGFGGVEFAGGFGNLSTDEMKAELAKNKLDAIGSHSGLDIFKTKLEDELAYLQAVGAKYMIIPAAQYAGMEDVDEIAEILNNAATVAAKYGIKVGYHNHHMEFEKIDGKYILDLLMEKTTKDVVFEVDVFWAAYSGVDPYEYLTSHKERIELIHLKQIGKDKKNVTLPEGDIDFKKIAECAKYAKYFIVEQEGEMDKAEACRINGEFIKTL